MIPAKIENQMGRFLASYRVRFVGSVALDLCLVACGAVDTFYMCGMHCWDIAAGDLIVREAGGCTQDVTG